MSNKEKDEPLGPWKSAIDLTPVAPVRISHFERVSGPSTEEVDKDTKCITTTYRVVFDTGKDDSPIAEQIADVD